MHVRDLQSPDSWAKILRALEDAERKGDLKIRQTIGSPNFRPVPFFKKMLQTSSAVGRVWVKNRDQGEVKRCFGTGFLIGPDLLITNNHVVRNAKDASHTVVWFNYDSENHGREGFYRECACLELLKCSSKEKLDYAILRLDGEPAPSYISLRDHGPKPVPNKDSVVIIQHPQGRPKEIVMEDTMVRNAWGRYIQYEADTEEGSSGAPVMDFELRIVALHHRFFMGNNQGVDIRHILDDASDVIA